MRTWFSEIMSIDEMKTSVLSITFIVMVAVSLYMIIVHGDVPPNLMYLLCAQITAIAGVNVISYMGKSNNSPMNGNLMSNQYSNQVYGHNQYPQNTSNMNHYTNTHTNNLPINNGSNNHAPVNSGFISAPTQSNRINKVANQHTNNNVNL